MQFLMGTGILMAGLLSVSIPIIIHLLHRQKTKPLRWGAMMFLKQSPLQMKRRKQLDHWLLMLLRMAALALLAWLIARPVIDESRFNPLAGHPPVDVSIVLDHSMSMGRHNGDHTLFEEGQAVVGRLIDPQNPIVRPGDTISIVLAEHRPRVLAPRQVGGRETQALAQLRDQLSKIQPGATDCTIPEAIDTARELLRQGLNRRKVVIVVSDEQKTNWSIGDTAAWQHAVGDLAEGTDHHVEVFDYPLAPDADASNITVGDIAMKPSLAGVDSPVTFVSTLSNSGPKTIDSMNVQFKVEGKEIGAPQSITKLGPGQSATLQFDHTFKTSGSTYVDVSTDVIDALKADNAAVAAVHVWDKLPVLVIDQSPGSDGQFKNSLFLQAAMQSDRRDLNATTLIQPHVMSVAQASSANLEDYYAVVINDVPQLPAPLHNKLPGYVGSGHGLWIVLGPRTTSRFITSLAHTPDGGLPLFDLESPAIKNDPTLPTIDIKDINNPTVAKVTSGNRNSLSGAVTEKWWSLSPKDSDAQVVIASSKGDPLVIERPLNEGRVSVWATSVDGAWNNFPAMQNFTPLVYETVYELSAAQTRAHSGQNIAAGEQITWSGPTLAGDKQVSVNVTPPDGPDTGMKQATLRNGRWEFSFPNTFSPGLYKLTFDPTEVPPAYYGVSIYRQELDNTPLSTEDQEWLKKGKFVSSDYPRVKPEQLAAIVTRSSQSPDTMWMWLAGVVVVSLCAETYMTYRMTRLQKQVDVASAGLTLKV